MPPARLWDPLRDTGLVQKHPRELCLVLGLCPELIQVAAQFVLTSTIVWARMSKRSRLLSRGTKLSLEAWETAIYLAVFGVTWLVNLIPCFKCRKMSTVEKYFVVVV